MTAAYSYDPYGTTLTATGTSAGINPYRYAAGITDRTTSWTKYGQRFDDPTTGTFTTPDTISRLADPTNANAYAYAADNPTNNTDPTGQDPAAEDTCSEGGSCTIDKTADPGYGPTESIDCGLAVGETILTAAGYISAPVTFGSTAIAAAGGTAGVISAVRAC